MTNFIWKRALDLVALRFVVCDNHERVVVKPDPATVFSHHAFLRTHNYSAWRLFPCVITLLRSNIRSNDAAYVRCSPPKSGQTHNARLDDACIIGALHNRLMPQSHGVDGKFARVTKYIQADSSC